MALKDGVCGKTGVLTLCLWSDNDQKAAEESYMYNIFQFVVCTAHQNNINFSLL